MRYQLTIDLPDNARPHFARALLGSTCRTLGATVHAWHRVVDTDHVCEPYGATSPMHEDTNCIICGKDTVTR